MINTGGGESRNTKNNKRDEFRSSDLSFCNLLVICKSVGKAAGAFDKNAIHIVSVIDFDYLLSMQCAILHPSSSCARSVITECECVWVRGRASNARVCERIQAILLASKNRKDCFRRHIRRLVYKVICGTSSLCKPFKLNICRFQILDNPLVIISANETQCDIDIELF